MFLTGECSAEYIHCVEAMYEALFVDFKNTNLGSGRGGESEYRPIGWEGFCFGDNIQLHITALTLEYGIYI